MLRAAKDERHLLRFLTNVHYCLFLRPHRSWIHHRQPKRTMFGFGLQRSFGRNILELLVYYLMPNKCKNLKIRSLLVCLSVLVAFKIMKVEIFCFITCDSGLNVRILSHVRHVFESTKLRKKITITRNIDSKISLTFSS